MAVCLFPSRNNSETAIDRPFQLSWETHVQMLRAKPLVCFYMLEDILYMSKGFVHAKKCT